MILIRRDEMEVEIYHNPNEAKQIALGAVSGGQCFYFASMSFQVAIEEKAIYMVVSGGKDSRIQIASLEDGLLLQRDDCHKVVRVKTKMTCHDDY
jgi:hypothetical protein